MGKIKFTILRSKIVFMGVSVILWIAFKSGDFFYRKEFGPLEPWLLAYAIISKIRY